VTNKKGRSQSVHSKIKTLDGKQGASLNGEAGDSIVISMVVAMNIHMP